MTPIAQFQLEDICREALNRVSRVRPVMSVRLGRPLVGSVNWTLREVEPRFDIHDVRQSHAVIRGLQNQYRMVC
jgi:hypothetical protein